MSHIVSTLAQKIARLIRSEDLAEGDPLPERSLAEQLLVSRSPVRAALRELEGAGIVRPLARGGHCVANPAAARALADAPTEPDDVEETYISIARDRLEGRIPDRISENELLRRTGITRPRLQTLLRRMSEEGWVERLPGNGWRFLPILTSMQTYRQSYTFRQAIEPAAIRDPGFTLKRAELERHLNEQRQLVAGEVLTITPVQLFQQNSALHEAICECSGNAFFIESLRRVNRLRRLIEYRQVIDRELARQRCAEHVQILELILAGQREEAATLMHRHLAALGPIKAPV